MGVRQDNVQVNVDIGGKQAGLTLSDLKKTAQQLNRELMQMVPGTEAFVKKAAELKSVNKTLEDVKQSVKGVEDNLGAAREEMVKMTPFGSFISNLKSGFDNLKGGIQTAAKGFTTLKGAIASTGIGLLLVAFAALVSYFKLTDEGQEKFERGMAAIKAIIAVLVGKVIEFGKGIMYAIENPVESIKKLGDLILNNLINRFKAFAIIWNAIKSGNVSQLTDGVIQLGTGIDNATQRTKDLANSLKDLAVEAYNAGAAAADLTRRTQELEDAERDLSVINEKRKGQIEQLMLTTKDQSLSEQQRLNNLKLAGQIEAQMTADSLRLAQERLSIIKGENALAEKSGQLQDDQKDKQAQAEIALIQIQNQSLVTRQQIANRESKFIQELADQRAKALEDQRKAQEDYNKSLLEAQAYLEDLQVANMEEGIEKKLSMLQNSYNDELALIKKNIEETEKNQKISQDQRLKLIEVYQDQEFLLKDNFDQAVGNARIENQKKLDKKLQDMQNKSDMAEADLAIVKNRKNGAKLLEARLDKLKLERDIELQNKELTEAEKALIEEKYIAQSEELYQEHANKRKEIEQAVMDSAVSLAQTGIQAIGDLSAIKTNNEISKAEKEKNSKIASLDQELKSKKITQDQYDSQKAAAEEAFNKKQRKLKQEQARKEKTLAITAATIDGILAVTKALSSAPPPLNFLLALASGAAAAFNIAKIASTPIPTFAKGGVISGSSHDQGGIQMIDRVTGVEIGEMEGEEIIMAKGVTRSPALRAAASRINVLGGGRAFASGGVVNPLSNTAVSPEGKLVSNKPEGSDGESVQYLSILIEEVRALKDAYENGNKKIKAYIVYSEFEEAKRIMDEVKSDASLKK